MTDGPSYGDESDRVNEEAGNRLCQACHQWFAEDDDCGVQFRAPEDGYRCEGEFCLECAREMNE